MVDIGTVEVILPAEVEDVELYHPKSWVTKYVFCQDAKVIAIQYSITAISHRIGSSCVVVVDPAATGVPRLSLSEIKFEHTDGAIRRELVSGECARRHCHLHPFYLSIARCNQSPDV